MVSQKSIKELGKATKIAVIIEMVIIMILLIASIASAEAFNNNRIADAIYWSEGDTKAHHPFGIESVSCDGYKDCRTVCLNTIRNNVKRWYRSTEGDFLKFLAKRYCPYNWQEWLKNVKYYVKNPKRI